MCRDAALYIYKNMQAHVAEARDWSANQGRGCMPKFRNVRIKITWEALIINWKMINQFYLIYIVFDVIDFD